MSRKTITGNLKFYGPARCPTLVAAIKETISKSTCYIYCAPFKNTLWEMYFHDPSDSKEGKSRSSWLSRATKQSRYNQKLIWWLRFQSKIDIFQCVLDFESSFQWGHHCRWTNIFIHLKLVPNWIILEAQHISSSRFWKWTIIFCCFYQTEAGLQRHYKFDRQRPPLLKLYHHNQ